MKHYVLIGLTGLSSCSGLENLLIEPVIKPEQWCENMPCVSLMNNSVVLDQPFSSLLVYLLGLVWLWTSWRFWSANVASGATRWWAVSLALGGIAAMTAGTSYQAFGYELKCAGQTFCSWTNFWEVTYMSLQVASLNAMLVAVAYSCTTGMLRMSLIVYAVLNYFAHLAVLIIGVASLNRFMLSFELVVLVTAPTFVMYFLINGWRYYKFRLTMDAALLKCWTLLVMTNVIYFAYMLVGVTPILWRHGIWFSENDVLHVCVALWLLYVAFAVHKQTQLHEPSS